MGLADIDSPEYVEKAIAEFDRLTRWRFLQTYGFRAARRYFIRVGSDLYDSKAVLGVAHRFVPGKKRALSPADFSGGDKHAVSHLRGLGFEVADTGSGGPIEVDVSEAVAVVLAQNEVTVERK